MSSVHLDTKRHINDFLIFVKKLDLFVTDIDLYDDNNLNSKLYNKLIAIERGFLQFINVYNTKLYNIDTLVAIKDYAKRTTVKSYRNKLLIQHNIKKYPLCRVEGGHIFKIIPYSCRPANYRALHTNPRYTLLGVQNIKTITQTQFKILEKIMEIDESISRDDWIELNIVRKKNEKNLFYKKPLGQ